MPRQRAVQNSFTSGELDPLLHERYDHPLYGAGCSNLENWFLKPQGALTRRYGTRFAGRCKNLTVGRLIPFIFSASQSAILEMGEEYTRIWVNDGLLVDDVGNPIELVTPYQAEQLDAIYYAQSGDIILLFNPEVAPYELHRLDALDWRTHPITFIPPPTEETGLKPGRPLVLSAIIGKDITITADMAIFMESDDTRVIAEDTELGSGSATITDVVDAMTVTATVTSPFVSVNVPAKQWKLLGSPVANLNITNQNAIGAFTKLTLQRVFLTDNPNLVLNPQMTSNLTSWTNASGGVVASGTATAGSGDELLIDSAATFLADGVRPGHRAKNTTDGTEDTVLAVLSDLMLTTSVDGAVFAVTEGYSVEYTGSAAASSLGAVLDGGPQGRAWIHQSITVVDGVTYTVVFNVLEQPLSFMVSTASGKGDLLEEFSYPVKNGHRVSFIASGTTAILEFRNNQYTRAIVTNVGMRRYDIAGWRAEDLGKYVKVNEGIVEIIEVISPTQINGVIRHPLNDTVTALKGAWSLETPMWSDTLGWPKAGCFFGSHLILTATDNTPMRVWVNKLLSLYDFSEGTADDMGFQFQVAATEINGNEWIIGERVLMLGSQREEITVRGSVGLTITPTSIEAVSPTKVGSAPVQPIRTHNAILHVQRGGKRLRELSAAEGVAENRINSDRSLYTEHLFVNDPIKRITYQQEPVTIVWALTEAGNLYGMSYLLDQKVFGWVRYPVSGRVVDIAVSPHQDGDRDRLWMIVDRDTGECYVEYMDDSEGFYGYSMTDSSIHGTFNPATTTISGLSHLDDMEVAIVTDGFPHRSMVVESGSLTLDYAATTVEVGLPFTPRLTTLRPVYGDTPLSGLMLSTSRLSVSLKNTMNLIVNGQRLTFSQNNDVMGVAPVLYTGVMEVENLGWDTAGVVTIEQDLPYPVTLLGVFRTVEVEEP